MTAAIAAAEPTMDDRAVALVDLAERTIAEDLPASVIDVYLDAMVSPACGDRRDVLFDDLVEAVRRRDGLNSRRLTPHDFGCLPGPNSDEAADLASQEQIDGAVWVLLFGPVRVCQVCRVSPRRSVGQRLPATVDGLCNTHAGTDGLRGRACAPVSGQQVKDGDDGARGGHSFHPEPHLRPAPIPGGAS